MADEILLNEAAYAVWHMLNDKGELEFGDLARFTGLDQSQVAAAATEAAREGFFDITEREREELIASDDWREAYPSLPEFRAAKMLAAHQTPVEMGEIANWAKSEEIATNEILKWGIARGWIAREKHNNRAIVRLTDIGTKVVTDRDYQDDDYRALQRSTIAGRLFLDELTAWTIDVDRVRLLITNRPELGKIKKRVERKAKLNESGLKALQTRVRRIIERNAITHEDLESGAWKEIEYRQYDVNLEADIVYPAKIHPLRKIIEQTRRAFLEMGFAEVVSPMVESAFWNFDALFQPQDHPAREMQDTFYMRHPAKAPLPTPQHSPAILAGFKPAQPQSSKAKLGQVGPAMLDIVDQVKQTHETGWTTGSEGWGYTWSPERSEQVVLRTHTTAATIRALAANPNPPGKFFCVGWTYRNETISFKHLPVFHQVDGIIIDEEANLASLMGTLQEFYSKMGFGRVKFKPAFYPYTEPSVDVVVYMESRGKWLEMGGAGIFRPEVTLPLGCNYPVLAWGLGIERLAMLRFGLSDIRDLYRSNLDALEEVPLCR